ncbi:hypothetical protein BDAP_001864 [Binucleata daphniae]
MKYLLLLLSYYVFIKCLGEEGGEEGGEDGGLLGSEDSKGGEGSEGSEAGNPPPFLNASGKPMDPPEDAPPPEEAPEMEDKAAEEGDEEDSSILE